MARGGPDAAATSGAQLAQLTRARQRTARSVAVECQPGPEGAFTQLHEPGQAPLVWAEVQALAVQHEVELLRNGQAIILRLPRAVVTTPLKMIPV